MNGKQARRPSLHWVRSAFHWVRPAPEKDEYYLDTEDEKREAAGKATLIIAEQRNGPVGEVPPTFLKEFTRFENYTEEA